MAVMKFKNGDGLWEAIETPGALKYTAQTLSEDQKLQARENIGLGSLPNSEVYSESSIKGKFTVGSTMVSETYLDMIGFSSGGLVVGKYGFSDGSVYNLPTEVRGGLEITLSINKNKSGSFLSTPYNLKMTSQPTEDSESNLYLYSDNSSLSIGRNSYPVKKVITNQVWSPDQLVVGAGSYYLYGEGAYLTVKEEDTTPAAMYGQVRKNGSLKYAFDLGTSTIPFDNLYVNTIHAEDINVTTINGSAVSDLGGGAKLKRLVISMDENSGADIIVSPDDDLTVKIRDHFGYGASHMTPLKGYHVILMKGSTAYNIKTRLYITNSIIEGETPNTEVKIVMTGSNNGLDTDGGSYAYIRNLTLISNAGQGVAIYYEGCSSGGFTAQNVTFKGFRIGVSGGYGCSKSRIIDCYFDNCMTGIALNNEVYQTVQNCGFNLCDTGIVVGRKTVCTGCHFTDCYVKAAEVHGTFVGNSVVVGSYYNPNNPSKSKPSSVIGVLVGTNGGTVSGNSFKIYNYSGSSAISSVVMVSATSFSTVIGNHFYTNHAAVTNTKFISTNDSEGVTVTGNVFTDPSRVAQQSYSASNNSYAIYATNSTNLIISGNSISNVQYPIYLTNSVYNSSVTSNSIRLCTSGLIVSESSYQLSIMSNTVSLISASDAIVLSQVDSLSAHDCVVSGNICDKPISYNSASNAVVSNVVPG